MFWNKYLLSILWIKTRTPHLNFDNKLGIKLREKAYFFLHLILMVGCLLILFEYFIPSIKIILVRYKKLNNAEKETSIWKSAVQRKLWITWFRYFLCVNICGNTCMYAFYINGFITSILFCKAFLFLPYNMWWTSLH